MSTNLYPPVPDDDLRNCHSYDGVDRIVVTKHHVYARWKNGSWSIIRTPSVLTAFEYVKERAMK
jgi:hypothetical protein